MIRPGIAGSVGGLIQLAAIGIVMLTMFPETIHAGPEPTPEMVRLFEESNSHYEKKEYSNALDGYMDLLRSGFVSAPVLLNIGNCWMASDDPVMAMVFFEQGLLLEPRSPALKKNLEIAALQAAEKYNLPLSASPEPSIFRSLPLDSWGMILAVTLSLALAGLSARNLRLGRIWKPGGILESLAVPCILLAVASAILFYLAMMEWQSVRAIVTGEKVEARFGPVEEAETAWFPARGTYHEVVSTRPGWHQIIDSGNRKGWVQSDDIRIISPPDKALRYGTLQPE